MLFTDDIVLIHGIREGVNIKLEQWRDILESKSFELSRSKAEYLHCWFSVGDGGVEDGVIIGGVVIPSAERFRYLASIIKEDGEIDEDINQRIKIGWQKWKNASKLSCDKKIPLRLKERVYRMVVKLALLYGAECWHIKKPHLQRIIVVEWEWFARCVMCGHTRFERIKNEVIRGKVGEASIEDKIGDTRLRWFGRIKRSTDALVRRCEKINLSQHIRGKVDQNRVGVKSLDMIWIL